MLLTVLNGLSKTTPVFSDVPNGKRVSQFSNDEALERGLRCFGFFDDGYNALHITCRLTVKECQGALVCLHNDPRLLERSDKSFI